ncbi:MAG: rbsB, ribose transport system substrate-binding protein [Gemmatimonadetes bacterium]|nr:rbsB, ribose transport system substrate-binding protein [Gemmatimonadota bacterium]
MRCFLTRARAAFFLVSLLAAAACAREKSNAFVVGFSQMESDNPWRLAETKSLKDEAAKRGMTLVVTDAQGQTAKQVSDVEDLIARKVNVILLAPRTFDGLAPALAAAKAAKIPVILLDRMAAGTPGVDYLTVLVSDQKSEGRRAADWLAAQTRGKASIVELSGTPGSSAADDRAAGFREGLAQFPDMKIIASQTGNFSRATGQSVMQNIAQSLGKKITAVFAHNDEMAVGGIQAMIAAGLKPGTDVLVVSVDGERAALEAIDRGEIGATVECNPKYGPLAFDTIEKFRKGEAIPPKIIVPDRFFDKTNAKQSIADAY